MSNNNIVQIYLKDLVSLKDQPLPKSELQFLVRQAKGGSEDAKKKLICSNLKFINKLAIRYGNYGVPTLDLINEGALGLLRAVETYDEKHETKTQFLSYAVWWIKAYMTRALNKQKPEQKNNNVLSLEKEQETCKDKTITFYDTLVNKKSISPENMEMELLPKRLVIECLHELNDLERKIVRHLYGICTEKFTIENLSVELKLPKRTITGIRDLAFTKIRKSDKVKKFKELFDSLLNYEE